MDNTHSAASHATTHAPTHAPKQRSSDFLAAITGLIVGGCVLFALVFGIVELTNHAYAGESTGPAPGALTTTPALTAP